MLFLRSSRLVAFVVSSILPAFVPVLVAAAETDASAQASLISSKYRPQKSEQQVRAELARLSGSQKNHRKAGELLTVLAALCAQQGRNAEADFFYQVAVEAWKSTAQENGCKATGTN